MSHVENPLAGPQRAADPNSLLLEDSDRSRKPYALKGREVCR
jgi:hypothetical protein